MVLSPTDLQDDLLTIAEAARVVKVSPVTIARWLKQGRLPAYRLGPRAVRIRRADLGALLRPTAKTPSPERRFPPSSAYSPDPSAVDHALLASIQPLTESQVRKARAAMEAARELRERILAERGGEPLPDSWPLIREAREER